MNIEIKEKRRKIKLIGVRLFREEYDLITAIAKKKKASRSFIAEALLRAAIRELVRERR